MGDTMVASNCEEEFVMKASLWVSAGIKMVNFSQNRFVWFLSVIRRKICSVWFYEIFP